MAIGEASVVLVIVGRLRQCLSSVMTQPRLVHILLLSLLVSLARHLVRSFVLSVFPFADYNITTTTLYFVRSGYVHIGASILKTAGYGSHYWLSLAASTIWGEAGLGAYYLGFNMTEVFPSHGPANRWVSFPLRYLLDFK